MPYFLVLIPFLAFTGFVGTVYWLIRGRHGLALVCAMICVGSVLLAIGLYYTSL